MTTLEFSPGLSPHFLAFSAIAPLPRVAQEALGAYGEAAATRGIGALPEWMAAKEGLREGLARLVGVGPDCLGLTHGTTHGVQLIATAIPWRSGDRMLCFDGEFPANVMTWQVALRPVGAEVVRVPLEEVGPAAEGLGAWLERLRPRVVAVSAVQFQTGRRMPIAAMAEVCHRHGAMLFVDAIQAAGVVPLDLSAAGVDFAAGGGHKWLLGADGIGWLYIRPERLAGLRPLLTGWLSVMDPVAFLSQPNRLVYEVPLSPAPRVFEGGSSSIAAALVLGASVAAIEATGVETIYAAIQAWHDAVEGSLVALGFTSERRPEVEGRSGILALLPPEGISLAILQRRLAEEGVIVTVPDGRLRLAPHVCSPLHRAQEVVAAVGAALDDQRRTSR